MIRGTVRDQFERAARFPTLHPQLEGEDIVIYLRYPSGSSDDGNYSPVFGEVLLNDASDVSEMTMLSARENDDMFDERTDMIEDHWTYCAFDHNVDRLDLDGEGDTDSTDSDTESSSDDSNSMDGFFDDLDEDTGTDNDDGSDEVTKSDLDPITQEFVETLLHSVINVAMTLQSTRSERTIGKSKSRMLLTKAFVRNRMLIRRCLMNSSQLRSTVDDWC
jgi:hypothetical protein